MLPKHQENLIAGTAICSVKAVRNAYRGLGTDNSRERIRRAAEALNLPAPPPRAEQKKAA